MSENTEIVGKTKFELIDEDDICREITFMHPELWDDLQWNEFDLKEKMEKNPFHYQQYRMLWLAEKHKARKIQMLMDEYIGVLYDSLKYGEKKLGKVEIERYYITKDPKAIKFNKAYMRQLIRAEVYEQIAIAFKNQGFAMNAYVKALQL